MKKVIGILLGTVLLFTVSWMPVLAETTTSTQTLIQQLQAQIEQLKTQIAALTAQMTSLREARQEVRETTGEIRTTLRLLRQLREGVTGDDVKLLQEILATDPDVYPEGLITGYFGPMTKNAVKRFQKIAGLDQVGAVGSQTLSRLNQLLTEGAGKSGKVPPGLLIAPGIRKKVDLELLKPLPGQVLPPGIAKKIAGQLPGKDVTPPVISGVKITDITTTSAKITWTTNEESDSKVWYSTTTPLVVTSTTPVVISTSSVLNHEILLSGLTSSTTYYFIVNSTDKAGNNEISEQKTFTTLSGVSTGEQACLNSGGTVEMTSCCLTANDFPNLCLIGACGCSTENSHQVKTCNCGSGKCFNGETCVSQ
jgi:peptidoglycan hydrolase-like protein with peptidoglycan-binding domain